MEKNGMSFNEIEQAKYCTSAVMGVVPDLRIGRMVQLLI